MDVSALATKRNDCGNYFHAKGEISRVFTRNAQYERVMWRSCLAVHCILIHDFGINHFIFVLLVL
jgi:hypothetical protein